MELVATGAAAPPSAQPSSTASTGARRVALFVALSLLVFSPFPFLNGASKTGALTEDYSDHVHHAFIGWVFLHKGLDTYRLQFRESWKGVDYRQRVELWGEMPLNYPPGILAVFLPVTLVGQYVPMSLRTFAGLGVWWMLLFAHLAMFAVFCCLRGINPPWARNLLVGLSYLVLLRLGLEGFYDSVWIAAAAMGVHALTRSRPQEALLWLCGAALLHYRAIALVPIGLYAVWLALKERPWRHWPWETLAVLAVTGVVCVGSFWLMYPATAEFRATVTPVWARGNVVHRVLFPAVLGLAVAAYALRRHLVVSATIALCTVLAIVDLRLWWHASLMMAAPLSAALFPRVQRVPLEPFLVVWWCIVQWQLWGRQYPTQVVVDLARFLTALE